MPKNRKGSVNTQINILVSSISFVIAEGMNDHACKCGGKNRKKYFLIKIPREEVRRRLSCQIRRGFNNYTKNTCRQKEINTSVQTSKSLNIKILLVVDVLSFR